MPRRRLWVGLDVGEDTMTACAVDALGEVIFEHSVRANAAALHDLLKAHRRRIELIALESGCAILLTRSLRTLGYRVAMFNSRQAIKFLAIRQNKTDKNDAKGLADIARVGRSSVSEVRVKSPECQRLRSTLVTRQKLVKLRVSIEGSIRSLILLNGGKLKRSSSVTSLRKNVMEALVTIRKREKIDLNEDVLPLLALSEAMRAYLETLDKQLNKMAAEHPICRSFLEIPGVGPISALSFYTAIEDPFRFRRNASVGAYLGMAPVVRQSGKSSSAARISKMGDAMTRSCLTTAALVHLNHADSTLASWGVDLSDRIGKRRAQTAVARKLAIMMLAMWKSNQPYDPKRGSSAQKDVAIDIEESTAA